MVVGVVSGYMYYTLFVFQYMKLEEIRKEICLNKRQIYQRKKLLAFMYHHGILPPPKSNEDK